MTDLDITTKRHGQVPSDDDIFWPEAMRHVQVDMMRSAQWAAGGVLLLDVMGWSLVAAALLFGEVGTDAAFIASAAFMEVAVWLLPLVLWSASAVMALRAFTVRRYRYFSNSPDATRDAVMRIGRKKTQHLYWSIALWVAGVIALIGAVLNERV